MEISSSARRLAEVIRFEAQEVLRGKGERIRLAAFIFGGCRKLIEEDRSADTGFSLRQEQWQLEEALYKLSELDLDLSIGELFGKLLSGLLAIDQSFRPDQNHPHPYHPNLTTSSTMLSVPGDPNPVLQGEVYHWVNIPSVLRRAHKIGRRKKGPSEFLDPVTKNLEYLTLYLSENKRLKLRSLRHEIVPRRAQLERSGTLVHQRDFRIALCPLIGRWHPTFEIPDEVEPPAFRAIPKNSILHPSELEEHLDHLISQSIEEGIRVLIFPELSLDEPQRLFIEKQLRERQSKLLTIFAGSFHTGGIPKPYNEAVALDAAGFRFWKHRKNSRYAVKAGTKLDSFFPHEIGLVLQEELPEYIKYGDELWFLDCSLGRLAMLICTDALDKHPLSYLPTILALRPELVMVLSMSDVTSDFESFVFDMARHGIGIAFINAACACSATDGADLMLLDLAIRKLPGAPPVRWRWPAPGSTPCWYDSRGKRWVQLEQGEEHAKSLAVWRLRKNGLTYGVVVDLPALLGGLLEPKLNS